MTQYNASEAQFWFEVGGEPEETFQLLEFYGSEAMSQLFRFEVKLIAPIEYDLKLPDFLNKPSKLTILREDKRKELHGILSDIEEVGRSKDFAQYHGIFVPRLWKLSLFYQSRVFQNQSVPDIIKEVLKGAGLGADDFKMQLKRTYSPREYCAQYRETDLNFISRLMEYEGIYYFFDHANGKDVVMIVDDNAANPKIDAPDEIRSYVGEGVDTEEESVRELTLREKVVTGKVVLKDYNYRTPETSLSAESQIDSKSPGMYYEYGEHFKTTSEGKTLAKIRNEEIEMSRRLIVGASDCRGFHPGYKFTLSRHYRASLNGDYLITQVSHVGSQAGGIGAGEGSGGKGPSYKNQFSCMSADIQYRPLRITPEPRVPGIMTAKVESAGGEYAYLDEEGRYRVKMPFDMSGAGSGKASRAIRLAQPYSGSGYGMHFPVHAGAELVWACVDGNVDRPIGLSTVPNPSRSTPVAAKNKSQNLLRTAAGNELLMEDMKGETLISLKTTDAHNIVLDDKDDKIDIITTKKHKITMDDKNQNITVQTTDGHLLIMDDKNTRITIQSKNGHFMTINDKSGEEKITLSDKDKKNTFIIDITNKKIVIKTDEGNIDMHAPKGLIDIKAKELKIETTGDASLKAANITTEAKSDHKVQATNIKQEAKMAFESKGMTVKAEASTTHDIKGLNTTVEAGVNLTVKGSLVTVQSTGPNTIKGMPVMIN
jgi:type VI secretion system secreted protein VgrG